jgi:hypothetical protein
MRAIRFLGGSAKLGQNMLAASLSRAVILIPILCLAAAAQVPASDRALASHWENVKMLALGTQIRIADDASKPGAPQRIQGTLESVTDSELVIKQGTGTQSFPRAQIVGVSVKKNEHRRRNALVGLGVGAAAGAAIGFGIGYAQCNKAGGWCGLDQAGGAAIGGIGGLVGGTLTGVFWPTGWRKIYTR